MGYDSVRIDAHRHTFTLHEIVKIMYKAGGTERAMNLEIRGLLGLDLWDQALDPEINRIIKEAIDEVEKGKK